MKIKFIPASAKNFNEWIEMIYDLWPHHTRQELEKEFLEELKSEKHRHFLAVDENGNYLGFINLSLRFDYVQGASSKPVIYVEGIYVKPEYRKQGVAKQLVQQAEKWALENGCKELASDAEIENITSQKFHEKLGFKKVSVSVHYIKTVNNS